VRQESYDIVYRTDAANEPRLRSLVTVIRSPQFRRLLSEFRGTTRRRRWPLRKVNC